MGDTLLGEKGGVMMESVKEVKRRKKNRKESRFGKRYGFELKLRCMKLRLEEGLPVSLLCKEVGVGKSVVHRWVKAYQERGEAGLRDQVRSWGSRRKLLGPVREKMFRDRLGTGSRRSVVFRVAWVDMGTCPSESQCPE